jgi:hypothetical protein
MPDAFVSVEGGGYHLDSPRPDPYRGSFVAAIQAHPAKTGVAKPRVLASSATPEYWDATKDPRPPSRIGLGGLVVFGSQTR